MTFKDTLQKVFILRNIIFLNYFYPTNCKCSLPNKEHDGYHELPVWIFHPDSQHS